MTLLRRRALERRRRRERVYTQTRRRLREELHDLIPGQKVFVFGSLAQPGRFHDRSDVDLALENEPAGVTLGWLMSELAERLDRPVDILLLSKCRFRDKILRQGEEWIP